MTDSSTTLGYSSNWPAPQDSSGGFGSTAATTADLPAPRRPNPLPKRPKGRLFVGAILATVSGLVSYQVWVSWFAYQAHGTVVGRVIQLPAPWNGAVDSFQVREGDRVRQGQALAMLGSTRLNQRLSRLADDLRLAQAKLAAQISRLKWESQFYSDERQRAIVEYYQSWSRLLEERSRLAEAKIELERARALHDDSSVSDEELDSARFTEQRQREVVGKLRVAVEILRRRADRARASEDDGEDQLRPWFAEIESIQAEMARAREDLSRGEIRSPVDGVVIRRHHFPGERAAADEPVLSILEEGSLELILYLPQKSSELLDTGDRVTVVAEPGARTVDCRVVRRGDAYEPAPSNIKRFYRADEKLLPVRLELEDTIGAAGTLKIGGVVKLPRIGFRTTTDDTTEETE